jgi:hypothetical protein
MLLVNEILITRERERASSYSIKKIIYYVNRCRAMCVWKRCQNKIKSTKFLADGYYHFDKAWNIKDSTYHLFAPFTHYYHNKQTI